MIKYTTVLQTFREVPDEVSLCFNISNCPIKCPKCHTPELQTDIGEELTNDIIDKYLEENEGTTCVTFLGHGDNFMDIVPLLGHCKNKGLKTCLYTGFPTKSIPDYCSKYLDYIKTDHYDDKLGGLNSKYTNQHFYKIITNDNITIWDDITERFYK